VNDEGAEETVAGGCERREGSKRCEELDKAWELEKGRHTYAAWRSAHFTPEK
jgi:hypothetical protein